MDSAVRRGQDVEMGRYVALLRGINVGGRAKLRMEDLRDVLRSLGHDGVGTYLQSGNALFASASRDPDALGRGIEAAIAERLGLEVKVMVRTPGELAAIVAANPFGCGSPGVT